MMSSSAAPAAEESAAEQERPNVVLIMTDNHGAWTLGCYGNPDIRTPNIDRLARHGTRFTRAFASNPVCSPTRATFLTGLMPSQHGVHSFLSGGRLQVGPQARCTLDQFTSLPEVLNEAGYRCGLVGKWHLGDNLHPQEGFDDYWITMPHGGTSTFYDARIIEDGEIRREPQYLTDFWTEHAVNFIDQQAEEDEPFFLFLAYNGPYALSRLLLREGRNRHAEYYADKDLDSFPREPTHPWQYSNRDYHNNPVSIRRVATEVSGIDDGVGTVMEALQKRGLDENTVVIFAADQGWVGGHGGFFGMGDHTRPVTARDGMMRIPMIWRQPGRIASEATRDRMVTNYDFMPTLLSYLGLGEKMPQEPQSPGRDFSAELTSSGSAPASSTEKSDSDDEAPEADEAVFYEFEGLRCIRTERWKYVHRHPNGPHELYDLENDPGEFNNLVDNEAHAETRGRLKRELEAFYDKYAEPQYNMWRGGGTQTREFVGIDEELAQQQTAEPPPLTDGFTPAEIQVPDGFTVELAAGPPLVAHPTMACFDDRGRLFVAENAGVNMSAEELEENLPNSIRLLEDTDGDGRFDRSTVFADEMTFPMGGAWHEGALYVASPPYIWRFEDTDDDGVADNRDILVSEFGYTGNAASIHGCFLGPDGRLYWCDGYHGHEFRDEAGEITSKREGSYLFSCRPDGSDVRIHCGGGMDNPVEVDFTDEGEMLGTVNILYSRPRSDCLVHWLYGGAYPHRERVLEELAVTGDLLGPVHHFGHVAISGMMRYRSGVMDHRWRDNVFATFFNSGKVVRVQLEPDGSTFSAVQREFLSGTSPDFHPTDVLEDADGSLLVIDTGGWFYRGCPTSQLAKPDILGGIYRVRRRGMTTQVDPWGKRIEWSEMSGNQLARQLNDTRHKVRERAIAECASRGGEMVPVLKQSLERRDIRERRNAVWALTRIVNSGGDAAADARAAIRLALDDRSSSIRQAACHSIATNPDTAAAKRLAEILQQDEPPVRRAAAKALGRIGRPDVVSELLAALAGDVDRSEEHSIVFALIEINDPSATAKGLAASKPAVRRGALIALDQMEAGSLAAETVAPMLNAEDEALRQTAVDIFRRRRGGAGWASAAAKQLECWLDGEQRTQARLAAIGELVSIFAGHDSVAELVGRALGDPKLSADAQRALLGAIASGSSLPLHQSWIEPLDQALVSEDPETAQQALSAVSAIDSDQFNQRLTQIAGQPERSALVRVAALEALSGRGTRLSDEAFEILLKLLSEEGVPDEVDRAAQILGASSLTTDQLLQLAPLLESAGPLALRDLIRPFQRKSQPEVGRAFLDAIENARSLLSLPANELSDVVKRYPSELRSRANDVLDRVRREDEQRLAKLDQLIPLLDRGDADRGREVFFSEKSKCATCHRVGEKGERVGPDLTTIGASRSHRDLLESIVFPSTSIVRQYEPYSIVTEDGRIYSGLITRETEDTVYVQPQTGDPVAVPREEIEEVVPSTVSIMPKGLEEELTEQQLADIVTWLQSLK